MATKKATKGQQKISPVGVAAFAHLAKPDSEGKYADNKYKVTLLLPKEGADNQKQIDSFVNEIRDAHKEIRGNFKKCPVKDGDEEDNEYNKGKWKMTLKSKFSVPCVDTKRKELPSGVEIRGGDLIRVAFRPAPYGDNEGLTLYLDAVQLVDKRAGGQGAEAFDEIEGFEASDDDEGAFSDDPENEDF